MGAFHFLGKTKKGDMVRPVTWFARRIFPMWYTSLVNSGFDLRELAQPSRGCVPLFGSCRERPMGLSAAILKISYASPESVVIERWVNAFYQQSIATVQTASSIVNDGIVLQMLLRGLNTGVIRGKKEA